MLNFLFWNVNRKPIEALLVSLTRERDIEVILLAECDNSNSLLRALNRSKHRRYTYHPNPVGRVEVFSSLPERYIQSLGDFGGLSFRRLAPPIGLDILLVGAHLPSRLYMSREDQAFQCTRLIAEIEEYENRLGHRRTVIVGDLNMNPFELGLTAAEGLQAVSSQRVAQRGSRVVHGKRYRFFYNPMWCLLGDRGPSPPGTYFYDHPSSTEFFWNMLDQVLVRPDLLATFHRERLEIITSVGEMSLIDSAGRPNKAAASDHLPIMFALDLLRNLSEERDDRQQPVG